jgi:hypothetical protein
MHAADLALLLRLPQALKIFRHFASQDKEARGNAILKRSSNAYLDR